jgi:hypothetical protein
MYSQLLKEILLEMQFDKEARDEFIDFLRIQYAQNTITLSSIDKFEEDYSYSFANLVVYKRAIYLFSSQ